MKKTFLATLISMYLSHTFVLWDWLWFVHAGEWEIENRIFFIALIVPLSFTINLLAWEAIED